MIKFLLSNGAEVDSEDVDGNTPLIFATYGNHAQSITLLLQNGASLTHTNYNGDSSFSIAVGRRLLAAQHSMENFIREYLESNCVKVTNAVVKEEEEEGLMVVDCGSSDS